MNGKSHKERQGSRYFPYRTKREYCPFDTILSFELTEMTNFASMCLIVIESGTFR